MLRTFKKTKSLTTKTKYQQYLKSTYTDIFYVAQENPIKIAFRALLNGPLLPHKTDIPWVEALRAYVNMIKCECVYRQFNFADIPYINRYTKKIDNPFIVNILKWSPSRRLVLRMQKRQRDLRRRKVYKITTSNYIEEAFRQVYLLTSQLDKQYDHFIPYLEPFKIVVDKFKVSKQVDEVIMHINNERILKQLKRDQLIAPMSTTSIDNIAETRLFYKS